MIPMHALRRSADLARRTARRRIVGRKDERKFCAQTRRAVTKEAKVWVALTAGTIVSLGAYKYLYHDRIPLGANLLLAQGKKAEEEGDFRLAASSYKKALKIVQASPFDEKSHFSVLYAIARCQDKSGDLAQAEQTYLLALAVPLNAESLDTRAFSNLTHWSALCHERLAQISQDRGDFSKALKEYFRALDLLVVDHAIIQRCWDEFEKLPDKHHKKTATSGTLDDSKLDWRGPLANGMRALNAAGVLNNIAMLFLEMNETDKARQVLGRCLAVSAFCVPSPLRTREFSQSIEESSDIFFDGDNNDQSDNQRSSLD